MAGERVRKAEEKQQERAKKAEERAQQIVTTQKRTLVNFIHQPNEDVGSLHRNPKTAAE